MKTDTHRINDSYFLKGHLALWGVFLGIFLFQSGALSQRENSAKPSSEFSQSHHDPCFLKIDAYEQRITILPSNRNPEPTFFRIQAKKACQHMPMGPWNLSQVTLEIMLPSQKKTIFFTAHATYWAQKKLLVTNKLLYPTPLSSPLFPDFLSYLTIDLKHQLIQGPKGVYITF